MVDVKKITILILLIAVVVIFFQNSKFQIPNTKSNLKKISIGSNSLSVEVVSTSEQLSKGLGDRDKLDSDGMLFVLPQRQMATFWMKDMLFALDFVWIDSGRVVDLTVNVPAQPGIADQFLRVYSPKSPVTHVLEMNAGEVAKRHIQVGDRVDIRY
ncbi:MAG TPA: DUF192 domain-containing protein [Patescibacteria group bacterium]|nr:DUF192 domain-containing protein [Patescibacteria group bacterium]